MIEVKTKSGFECTIDDEAVNDWELLELLQRIDDGDMTAIVKTLPKLLGEEQAKALKEHLRNANGRVPMDKMVAEITEIMNGSREGKNS